MARSLDQVLTELDTVYAPQVNNLRKRQSAIAGEVRGEEQGLQAQQQTAFGDILNGARRRGTGVAFGGIPMQEQARYTADNFLPALARLKQGAREKALSLEDAILGIQERRTTTGQQIYQNEQQMAEQRRQFQENLKFQREQAAAAQREAAANRAAQAQASAGIGAYLSGMDGGNSTPQYMTQRKDKGFQFKDQSGNPISAAAYAAATGTPFRQLLQKMASAGDNGAKQALGFVGDDFGYDPRKVNPKLYNALTWGIKPAASAQNISAVSPFRSNQPASRPQQPAQNSFNNIRMRF